MTSLVFTLLLAAPASDPVPDTSKPVGATRDEEKDLLEQHKKAKPRLPFPEGTPTGVNNGWFRSYYVPADLRGGGGAAGGGRGEGGDPALDYTFKTKLFWITSRANNCYYCLGHQELKLAAAGVGDDDIAILDGDWVAVSAKERAAYAFTKKLTHTPHLVTAADVEALKAHYTPAQVSEILVTVAGYNSTNRWTDGLNIPAEASGMRFKRDETKADLSTFKTPTSSKYAKQRTTVAPIKLPLRPPLEPRDKVEALWRENRSPVLPIADAKTASAIWTDGPAPNWVCFLATFPQSMKGRVAGLKAGMEKGTLGARLSAEIAWVAARNDRAWYALAVARDRLKKAGLSEDQMFALDGDRKDLPESERSALALVETLTVAPWKVTDEMVERCRKSFTDSQVGEIFHHTCNAAFFDRFTEVAKLPFEPKSSTPHGAPALKLPEGVTPESLADPKEAARVADLLDKQYPKPQPEGVRMLTTILRGSQLNGKDGWFDPAQTRYTWEWLLKRQGLEADAKAIPQDKFRGPADLFVRLDRDGDGAITRRDLDWSDTNPYVQQASMLNRFFRRLDASGDGKLTRDELERFFKLAADGKDYFTAEDLRRVMIPRGPNGFSPGDAPTVPVLVRSLFTGELGTIDEGPRPGDKAPDFTLKTVDGKETVTLSKLIGPKPVVLVLGNFTCGPFRALYPDLEALHARYGDRATFLMVYVREAHPSDGWHMESNARMGVKVAQPRTTAERERVCGQFCKMLAPKMPVVVDEVSDPVGKAYSGMPGRLYVIDPKGIVAYQNGRGPFGFHPGELEQALVMCLLETGGIAKVESDK